MFGMHVYALHHCIHLLSICWHTFSNVFTRNNVEFPLILNMILLHFGFNCLRWYLSDLFHLHTRFHIPNDALPSKCEVQANV